MQALLAQLPAVHLLADQVAAAVDVPRWAALEAARRAVAERRAQLLRGEPVSPALAVDEVAQLARSLLTPPLRPVINATGVVLHTNLGRAPLAAAARRAVDEIAAGYSNLEYDLAVGARGSRHDHLRTLLRQLTGAQDALVVNNNAAATVLGLAALAAGKSVIVSRGELVEIGGSFRLPEILALSGCKMVEVGTTNKTRAEDYARAITADTALLLKVHRSNFAIVGFTAEASAEELVQLARAQHLASAAQAAAGAAQAHPDAPTLGVMIDLGSGALLTAEQQRAAGLPLEPTVAETVASGADLVTISGDKLLGGPQAGILLGSSAAIARARKHPLMRVVRPDKLTLAALAATLACYRDARLDDLPAVAMLRRTADQVRALAEAALTACVAHGGGALTLEILPSQSTVGGGAMPTAQLPSWALVASHPHKSAEALEAALRSQPRPIIGRLEAGRLWLDLRAVQPDEIAALAQGLAQLA